MSAPALSSRERARLRAAAHALSPVVAVGQQGVHEALVAELDHALLRHELIKVRLPVLDADAREALVEQLAAAVGAVRVGRIGRVLILWRPRPEATPDTATDLA